MGLFDFIDEVVSKATDFVSDTAESVASTVGDVTMGALDVTLNTIEKSVDLVGAGISATVETVSDATDAVSDFAKENPEEVFNIYSQSGIPAEVYKKAYSADLTFSNFDPAITDDTKEKMQKLIDFLYDNQIVKNKISVDDIITTEYYDKYKSSK